MFSISDSPQSPNSFDDIGISNREQREDISNHETGNNSGRVRSSLSNLFNRVRNSCRPNLSRNNIRYRGFQDLSTGAFEDSSSSDRRAVTYFVDGAERREACLNYSERREMTSSELILRVADAPEVTHIVFPNHLKAVLTDDDILSIILRAPTLIELDLSDCARVTGSFLKRVGYIGQLESLNLSSMPNFDCGHLRNLEKCPVLCELSLWGTSSLQDKDLENLQFTRSLTSLSIGGTKISGSGLKFLQPCGELKNLSFSGCSNLRPKYLEHLKSNSKLETMDIWGCDLLAGRVGQDFISRNQQIAISF